MKSIIASVALIVCCVNVVLGESEPIDPVCKINGQIFAVGESVERVIDGCNNCMCLSVGFACTRMGCPWYEPLDCQIQGQQYKHGDDVPSDECFDCKCMNGNLACTNCPSV